jgi:gluconolactonase
MCDLYGSRCREPEQIQVELRHRWGCKVEGGMLAALEAHLLCHPTNLAFTDNVLFTTNLGRWPITAIETRAEGLPLYGGYGARR